MFVMKERWQPRRKLRPLENTRYAEYEDGGGFAGDAAVGGFGV